MLRRAYRFRCAVEPIVAGAASKRVVAVLAREIVGRIGRAKSVVSSAPRSVSLPHAIEPIRAGAAAQPIVAVLAVEAVVAVAPITRRFRDREELIVSDAAVEPIIAGAAVSVSSPSSPRDYRHRRRR